MTQTPARPIETRYAGCRFRSRLEARWAVFFDTLGIKWTYEPQGFHLPSGELYLPDFHLPDVDLWVEVKGDGAAFWAERHKYAEAALHLGGEGLMILGPTPDLRLGMPQHFIVATETHCCGQTVLCLHIAWADHLANPIPGFPCSDSMTHQVDLPPLKSHGRNGATWTMPSAVPDWPVSPEVTAAYEAARSARFEHGEAT